MKKISLLVVALMLVMALLTGCGGSTAPDKTNDANAKTDLGKYTIRIALENSETYPATLGLAQMKKYVEKHTDGNVTIDIYANGQLGGEEQTIDQVNQGTLEMAVASFAPIGVYQNKFYVMDIPFMFETYNEAWMVMDSYVGTDLMDTLEEVGLKGLAYMENGFRHTTNNNQPITGADSYKGLKIRTMQNANHMADFASLGANPTPIPFSELYLGLQQKIADGQENPIANVIDKKLYEVQSYLSLTGHLYDAMPLVCNLKWWNSLPAEYQAVIAEGAIYAQNYSRFCNADREVAMKQILTDNGMKINELTPEALAGIRDIAQPAVRDLVIKTSGKEYVEGFLKDVEAVKADIGKGLEI